jgi:hypothetical protein
LVAFYVLLLRILASFEIDQVVMPGNKELHMMGDRNVMHLLWFSLLQPKIAQDIQTLELFSDSDFF